jgi:hypothetical protein
MMHFAHESLAQRTVRQRPMVLRHTDVVMHVHVDVEERARIAAARENADSIRTLLTNAWRDDDPDECSGRGLGR